MVIYDLICSLGHEFEGWFKNSNELASQQASGMLTCPYCNSIDIHKKVSAPKVAKKSNATSTAAEAQDVLTAQGFTGKSHELMPSNTKEAEAFSELQNMLGKVHEFIESNFEDVGNRFADEARSIQAGEKEAANIRGIASKEEIVELANEGVVALPLPPKPISKKDLN